MSDFDPRSTRWLAGLVLFISLLTFSILGRLYYVSLNLGPELVAAAREKVIQERQVPASRGNIYSSDGQLLATSMPVYELRWDAAVVDEKWMDAHIAETAQALARLLPERTASEWGTYLRQQYNGKRRYALIAKNLSYSHYRKVAQTPLFEGSKFKTGLIAEERFTRLMPLGGLAERTIGYQRPDATAGLEASFPRDAAGARRPTLDAKLGRQPMEAHGEFLHPRPPERPRHHHDPGRPDARCRPPRFIVHPQKIRGGSWLRRAHGGKNGENSGHGQFG